MDTLCRTARRLFWLVVAGMVFINLPARALLPFPLNPGRLGFIPCLENSNYIYECYLPPNYSTNGSGTPILYTFNPGGGSLAGNFLSVCESSNWICICITNTHNNMSWDLVLKAMYVVTRDVRSRILYDPSEEFAGGLSGGGECSYMFARLRGQHVAGLIEVAGWLGRLNVGGGPAVQYYGIDRVQTNLIVTRTTGSTDTGAQFYNVFDSNFLATCNADITDYTFTGGHTYPPPATMGACFQQLILLHQGNGPNDQSDAQTLYTNWQARIATGDGNNVLRECMSNLMNFPRTWFSYQAEQTLDQLLTNYNAFSRYDVSNLAQGDYAADLFYYYARGAANAGDTNRYYSCLHALTGITATNDYVGTITISNIVVPAGFPTDNGLDYITTVTNDHANDVSLLETNFGYGKPWLQISPAQPGSPLTLTLLKSAPWLQQYEAQGRSDFVNGSWSSIDFYNDAETPTIWSATVDPLDPVSGYYRLSTRVGGPGYSSYWPVWTPQ